MKNIFKHFKNTNENSFKEVALLIYQQYSKEEILIFIEHKIELPSFVKNYNNKTKIQIFHTLKLFFDKPNIYINCVLKIFFRIIELNKNKYDEFARLVHLYLSDELIITSKSFLQNFEIQKKIVDFLFVNKKSPNSYYIEIMLFNVAQNFVLIKYSLIKQQLIKLKTFEYNNFIYLRKKLWTYHLSPFMATRTHSKASVKCLEYFVLPYVNDNNKVKNDFFEEVINIDKNFIGIYISDYPTINNYKHFIRYTQFKSIFPNEYITVNNYIAEKDKKNILTLIWSFLNGKYVGIEFQKTSYSIIKQKEIYDYLIKFSNIDYFSNLFSFTKNLINEIPSISKDVQKTIEIVMKFISNTKYDFKYKIITKVLPYNTDLLTKNGIEVVLNTPELITEFYNNLSKHCFTNQFQSKQMFFSSIKKEFINKHLYNKLFELYKNPYRKQNIDFSFWYKYKEINPNIFIDFFNYMLTHLKPSLILYFNLKELITNFIDEFENDKKLIVRLYEYRKKTDANFTISKEFISKIDLI